MSAFVFHIGAPRTGTTVIQKHATSLLRNHVVIQKRPNYGSGSVSSKNSCLAVTRPKEISKSLRSIDPVIENISSVEFFNSFIANLSIGAAQGEVEGGGRKLFFPMLCEAFKLVGRALDDSNKNCFLSSERFCDTSASLVCSSSHGSFDRSFPLYSICEAISIATLKVPLVTVCLREPVSYLRSKYLRTCLQRRGMKNARKLSPSEYIKKQAKLELSSPGTSVLFPAMHGMFVKQLQKHAFVKAFGFQELLESDDVFSLMGLCGESKYSFKSFPAENAIFLSRDEAVAVEIEIERALKEVDFYDLVMGFKLFD